MFEYKNTLITAKKYHKELLSHIRRAQKEVRRRVLYPRIVAVGLSLLLLASVLLPVVSNFYKNKRYDLNSYAHTLLGETNANLDKKLVYNQQERLFQFNKEAKKDVAKEANPLERLQSKVGGAGKEDEQQYSVDVSEDLSKGIAYYDNQMELSFKMVPQFKTMSGQKRDGHLIYPLSGGVNGQVAYTVEANGLKENVVLYESPGDTFKMSYKLELPSSLEAKLIPGTGELGIYSADPALFGSITYGSSDDQARVEGARNNSPKTFLTFVIPAPVVMGLNGASQSTVSSVKSHFEFKDNILTVASSGLEKASYPLAIDPSVTVDSTSDFQSGNMEDNNSQTEYEDLRRNLLTGGSINVWQNSTALNEFRSEHVSVAYNGYLYTLGGRGGSSSSDDTILNDVSYTSIDADGSVGSWTSTTSLPTPRTNFTAVVYNGYLYIAGGYNTGILSDVQYAPIHADGSVGSWTSTTSLPGARYNHTSVVYNGYLYVLGGSVSGYSNSVQYAPINANGTIGAWASTTSFATNRAYHASVVYNNYLYVTGGYGVGNTQLSDVQYAPINANGSIGTWTTTTALPSARGVHSATVHNGYLYIAGGNGTGFVPLSDVQYAPINANGSIGNWGVTSSLYSNLFSQSTVAYKGHLYIVGGATSSGKSDSVQYGKIDPPGSTSGYSATTIPSNRGLHASVAYGGYLYILGGYDGTTYYNSVQYAPINANGTIGAWTTNATSFAVPRLGHAAVAYNGYMYISGGQKSASGTTCLSTGSSTSCNDVQYAPINANGSIGTWTTLVNMGASRFGHASIVSNGYLYVLGGNSSGSYLSDIRYAPINANGTIGAWTTNATSFADGREGLQAVTYSKYVYILGGSSSSGAIRYNDVQYAAFNTDGSIGAWTPSDSSFSDGRDYFGADVRNGYLYIAGGRGSGQYYDDTQYAQINSDGTLGSWSSAASFGIGRGLNTAVIYGGYIYAAGGYNGSNYVNTLQYAQINNGGTGTVNTWTTGSSFTNSRFKHTSVASNGYLYVLGGQNGTTYYNDVQMAPINSDGTLGTWTSTTSFANARSGHTSVASNGYLYVLGGQNGTTYYNDVQMAPINSDGTLGTWTSTTSFANARSGHTSVASNGYLYVLGGADNGPVTQIYSGNGSMNTYVVPSGVTSVTVEARGAAGGGGRASTGAGTGGYGGSVLATLSVTPGESLYATPGRSPVSVAGGYNGGGAGGYQASTTYGAGGGASDIRKGGTTLNDRVIIAGGGGGRGTGVSLNGAGGNGGGLVNAANGSTPVPVCGVGGGGSDSTGGSAGILAGSVSGTAGSLGQGGAGGLSTPGNNTYGAGGGGGGYYGGGGGSMYQTSVGCGGGGGSSYVGPDATLITEASGTNSGNGYISISYGGPKNDVQYAQINSDGTLGSWQTTTSLGGSRTLHASTVNNGYVYVLGGSGNLNDVQYAQINSDGTLGSWQTTTRFNIGRYGFSVVTQNGFMYIMGGYHSTIGYRNDTQYASIHSDGSLGVWNASSSQVTGRSNEGGNGGVVYKGRLYMAGGNATGGLQNNTEYASLNSIPRRTGYSKVIDFKTNSLINSINYTGNLPSGLGAIRYKVAGDDGVFGGMGNSQAFSCSVIGANRYIQLFVDVDDSGQGIFRDEDGTNYAALDSLVVDTTPLAAPTEYRLRHGAFFQGGVLQPFSTNNAQCNS